MIFKPVLHGIKRMFGRSNGENKVCQYLIIDDKIMIIQLQK